RAGLEELPRRGADVEPLDPGRVALAADDGVLQPPPQGLRFLDLAGAENALVAGRERLHDRGRCAEDVDHDPDFRGRRLIRCESDVDRHRGYASPAWPYLRRGPATAIRTASPGSRARNAAGRSARSA